MNSLNGDIPFYFSVSRVSNACEFPFKFLDIGYVVLDWVKRVSYLF